MSLHTRLLSFAALVAATFAAGGGQAAAATVRPAHPGSSWQKVAPAKVGLNANAKELRGRLGALAEIGFRESRDLENFQGHDGQKHVDVDVRDHRFRGNGGMGGEIF